MIATHILDKDTVCETPIIIKQEGRLFCKVENELQQSWEVMKNRITNIETGEALKFNI